jgi:hypothetical protein
MKALHSSMREIREAIERDCEGCGWREAILMRGVGAGRGWKLVNRRDILRSNRCKSDRRAPENRASLGLC